MTPDLPNQAPSLDDLRSTDRLRPAQRRFLEHLAQSGLQRRFYLAGGAALTAGYLAHRTVDDLDLFGPDEVPISKLLPMMKALPEMASLQWLLPRDRTTFLITWSDETQVKVEYRQFPFAPVMPPWPVGPFYIASLTDLLADKIAALTERRYGLDRFDILTILSHEPALSLDIGVALAEAKFGLAGELTGPANDRMMAPRDEIPPSLHDPAQARALLARWLAAREPVTTP